MIPFWFFERHQKRKHTASPSTGKTGRSNHIR